MPRTKLIDTQLLSYILDFLSVIADLSFSIYDGNGVLLMPPKSEKRLTAYRKSYTSESKENEAFICEGVVKAVIRRDPFLFKGHAKGYYLFIPVYADNFKLVLVSNAFYLSRAEFEDFLPKNEERFDVSTSHPELGDETLKVKDYSTVLRMAVHIKYLIEAFLRCDHAKKMNYKRFKSANIITDVLSSIQLPASTEKIYSLVLDTILLLFDVDTISIMVNGKNVFKTLMASGRLRNDVKHLCLEDDHPLLSLSTKEFIPVFTNDVMKIMRLGFLNDITSMHVFPLSYKEKIHSLVVLYNSIISEEESHSILEFCKLVTLVLESLTVQNAYEQCVTDIDVLNIAVTKLIPHLHNHKALCETILYKAMELSNAEKGSLMLPEDDSLVVKTVKG
ncbi:MAG TPA: hypothetical protein VEF37_06555, partial [Thermodesulfovibrionales bacterium]|nr:hypothetical protein [Thermodesulfovibrionales bacterium]